MYILHHPWVAVCLTAVCLSATTAVQAADTSPDTFKFAEKVGVTAELQTLSESVTITGIDVATAITVTGGQYRVYNGKTWTAWTSRPGTVKKGNKVQVRLKAAAAEGAKVSAALNIGGITAKFVVQTNIRPTATGQASVSLDEDAATPITLM